MKEQLFHVENKGWYVRTTIVLEGPFATQAEAANYLALLKTVSAAGVACGWPVPRNKSDSERQMRRAKILYEIALAGFAWVRRHRKNNARTFH